LPDLADSGFPHCIRRLESRGKSGNGDEGEESSVEGNARSAVLVIAVTATAGARAPAVGGVLVGVLVVGSASVGALDVAAALLLLQLVAGLIDIGSAGDIKGALNAVERGEFNPRESIVSIG
jgi:hypothetical protein